MRIKILISLLLSITLFVYAGNEPEADTVKTYIFDPVTITATRTAANRSVVAPSISVIPQEILAANTQKSILSLISQQVPGVFVMERGVLGFGVATSSAGQVSVRGVGGSPNTQVLIMIDGRPQFMGLMGHPLADSYLSASAERIEVIRGPASVLYGSNAMGGVINIITHSTQENGLSGKVSIYNASYDTRQISGKIGYQTDSWNLLSSFVNAHTDGHRPQSEFNANSGYLKASTRINEQFSISIDGSITGFSTYDPGTITAPKTKNNFVKIRRGYTGISIDNDHNISKGSTRLIYNFGKHNVFDGTDWVSTDYNLIFSAYQTLNFIADNAITVGTDFNKFGGKGKNKTRDYGAPSVYEYALYTNVQHTFLQSLVINGGLRLNNHEIYGTELIQQLGASYRLANQTTVRASASKGYRSPTIRELYLFPAPTPTLEPENMWNYEVGLLQTVGNRFFSELTVFQSEGKNLIRTMGKFPNITLSNSGSFIYRGVEIAGTYLPVDDLQVQGNYTFIDSGNNTRSVPKHKMFVSAQYNYNIFSFNVSAQHIEVIYGSDNKRDRLPNFTNLSIKIDTRILPTTTLSIGVENLLDEIYFTMLGYPMPGRTFSGSVQASF